MKIKYLIHFKSYNLINYYSVANVKRKSTVSRIDTISMMEFKEMCVLIKLENSLETLSTGENKYHYYNWLENAFKLALLTGLRRDVIVYLKFSDIEEQDGKLIFIKAEDYKYNKRYNLVKEEEKKYNYVSIILELEQTLKKL